MAEELADEDLVDYEEDQDEGDDKGADEVKKCMCAADMSGARVGC